MEDWKEKEIREANYQARKMARSLYFLALYKDVTDENLKDIIHQRDSLRLRIARVRERIEWDFRIYIPHSKPGIEFRGDKAPSYHHAIYKIARDPMLFRLLQCNPKDPLWGQLFPIVGADMGDWEFLEIVLEKEFGRAVLGQDQGRFALLHLRSKT